MPDLYTLRRRFETLCSRALHSVIPFGTLFDHYERPPRAYHNLDHIAHMLGEFDGAKSLAQSPDTVEFAIWYHDAIYDARAKDNEEKSAIFAREQLEGENADADLIKHVEALILATRHQHPPATPDEKLLVDCDLAILGQSEEKFDAYEKAIRLEYDWVPDSAFRVGRTKVLQSFLQRDVIFSLKEFQIRYEARARQNLVRSIERLSR